MDLKELIAKLNALDVKDFKKIDYKKFLDVLRQRPGPSISIVLICVTVLICSNLYLKRRAELKNFKRGSASFTERIKTIGDYVTAKQELTEFIAAIPENIEEGNLVTQLTGFAESRNVTIQSLLPTKKRNESFYDLTGIILEISAKEYKDIWLFIHDIEESPYILRVDKWEGRREWKWRSASNKSRINVRLEIASLSFKKL